jgi:pyruvate dehydrogenase E2 component (dihydrolipoamide acetyltransferase)
MPSLGADMEAGTLVEWLKKPGDRVSRGDIIAVVETQKGAIEIEVFQTGMIETLLAEPGQKLAVGAPMAFIRVDSEKIPGPAALPPRAPPVAPRPPPAIAPQVVVPAVARGLRVSPAARRRAAPIIRCRTPGRKPHLGIPL